MSIRNFLLTFDLKIDLTEECTPHATQRVVDEFIMDAMQMLGDCTSTELMRLNACRLFLQVSRLSDLSLERKRLRDGPTNKMDQTPIGQDKEDHPNDGGIYGNQNSSAIFLQTVTFFLLWHPLTNRVNGRTKVYKRGNNGVTTANSSSSEITLTKGEASTKWFTSSPMDTSTPCPLDQFQPS